MSGRRPPNYKEAEYDVTAKPPPVPIRQTTPNQVQPRYRTPSFIPSGKEEQEHYYASPSTTPPPTSPTRRQASSSTSSVLDRPGAIRRSDGSIIAPGAVAMPGMTTLERQQYILPPPGAMAVIPAGSTAYQRQRQAALAHILVDEDASAEYTGEDDYHSSSSVTILVNGETDDSSNVQEPYDDENIERMVVGGTGAGGNRGSGGGHRGRRRRRISEYTVAQAEIVVPQHEDSDDNGNVEKNNNNINDISMEEDIEARVQARLQEETQNITDRVRQQIIQEASHATVVKRPSTQDNNDSQINAAEDPPPAIPPATRATTASTLAGSSSQYTSSSNSTTTSQTNVESKKRRFLCCCCCRPLFCFLFLGILLILGGVGVGVTFSTKIQDKIENTEFPTLPWFTNTNDSNDNSDDDDGDDEHEDNIPSLVPTSSPTNTISPTMTMAPTSSWTRYEILQRRIGDALLSLANESKRDAESQSSPRSSSLSPMSSTTSWDFSLDGIVALEWLANNDPAMLNAQDTSIEILLERFAVVVLYIATGGYDGQWIFNYSFLSYLTVCDWNLRHMSRGIFCSGDTKQVTDIILSASNLRGTIPSEIACLSKLRRLQVDNNVLWGSIPGSSITDRSTTQLSMSTNPTLGLHHLTSLEVLDLHNNALSGLAFNDSNEQSLFRQATNLRTMYLHGNRELSGTIPSSIQYSTNLINLSLMGCSFDGTLPQTLDRLSNLWFLQLYDNEFSGSIPSSIVDLSEISYISLGHNKFTGTIPEFGSGGNSQPNLYLISLSTNQLTGTIPSSISSLSVLETLSLHTNSLEGSIPDGLDGSSLNTLEELRLHSNLLTGTVPDFAESSGLKTLNIAGNMLESDSLDEVLNLHLPPNLEFLDISANSLFKGTIPNEIGKQVSKLTHLRTSNCQMFGTIPSEIGLISGLHTLDLSLNDISGTIPAALSGLRELQSINLSNNDLTGTLMSEIARINTLKELNLANNKLSGSIPEALTTLADHLDILLLSGNNFVGNLTNTFCTTSEDYTILRSIPNFQADCLLLKEKEEDDNGSNNALSCDCCTKCCGIVNSYNNDDGGGGGASEVICESNFIIVDSENEGEGEDNDNSEESATAVVQLMGSP